MSVVPGSERDSLERSAATLCTLADGTGDGELDFVQEGGDGLSVDLAGSEAGQNVRRDRLQGAFLAKAEVGAKELSSPKQQWSRVGRGGGRD